MLTSALGVAACAVCACVLAVTVVGADSSPAPFVAAFIPQTNLPGYTLASLADIRSAAFVEHYNAVGLNFVQEMISMCCVVSVEEGFLAIGTSLLNMGYIEPYLNDTDVCTSNTMPQHTIFGVPPFAGGNYANTPLQVLSEKNLPYFFATKTAPPSQYGTECMSGASNPFIAVFKYTGSHPSPAPFVPKSFVVQPHGANYPAPAGYSIASLEEVRSESFISFYNSNGGVMLSGVGTTNYCCMIRILNENGFLTVVSPSNVSSFSPLSLLATSGTWSCGLSSNNQIHIFGTAFGGPIATLMPTLNRTVVDTISYFTNDTANFDNCNAFPDVLTLFVKPA